MEKIGIVKTTVLIHEDNQSCIKLTERWEHKRLTHVDVKYNFVKVLVNSNEITVNYINTNEQVADILTKQRCGEKFNKHRFNLGLRVRNAQIEECWQQSEHCSSSTNRFSL